MTFRTIDQTLKTSLSVAVFGVFMASTLVRGDDAAAPDAPPSEFKPGDIAIGEPIPLRFAAPRAETTPPTPGTASETPTEPRSLLTDPQVSAANPVAQARGTGWIGLQVAESTEAGRWAISEVALGGPAATAGITVGDEVRAIDGVVLQSADHVAQALTALAAGQRVKLAMARAGQPLEITVVAVERPVALSSRTWQSSQEPDLATSPPAAPSAFGAAPPAFSPSPSPVIASPMPEPSPLPQSTPATDIPRAAPLPTPSPAPSLPGRTALGVRTVPIDHELQSRFNLPDASGAYVIGVVQDLPASRAGVPPGSVIVALDNRPVRSPDELTKLVTSGPVGRPVPLQYILPGGALHRAEVVLQSLERPLEAALVGPAPLSPTPAPSFQTQPPATTVRRPATERDRLLPTGTERDAIHAEIRDLRMQLDELENRLEAMPR